MMQQPPPPSLLPPPPSDLSSYCFASPSTRIRHIIAVSSCKGGVGKSTISANLAFSLSSGSEEGPRVGVLDADVFGPSLPLLVAPDADLVTFVGRQIRPLERGGLPPARRPVKLQSFGYVNEGAATMRGPMVNQLLKQFLDLTAWGELEYLVVDLPPGTGDVQLTLCQELRFRMAVVVATPSRLAWEDVRKGIDMFEGVGVPCRAVVENMAFVQEDDTNWGEWGDGGEVLDEELRGRVLREWGEGGGDEAVAGRVLDLAGELLRDRSEAAPPRPSPFGLPGQNSAELAEKYGIDATFSLPIYKPLADSADTGTPFVLSHPESAAAAVFRDLADTVEEEAERLRTEGVKGELTLSAGAAGSDVRVSDAAGSELGVLPARELRLACGCASCKEEFTGRKLLDEGAVPEDVRPQSLRREGNYAVQVVWDDGHRSLYPYGQIRELLEEAARQT
ncbi:hypothetical protein TeGR_g11735 [Tetraparma gracilis]|uniref:Gamma-butyrobetaine hydroxylase-like N-terminal domain-containing protein n=1 Tax=Tetraparma gracilis TaxID=2962635 RepID=A0ABQ6MJ46_9STRA|nr:hypothetical protein TeGR_g11735 [Tetraparma gracilis]